MLDTKTVQDYIRTIPDFPHEGILFRDVTTLFLDPRGFRLAVDQLLAPFVGQKIDLVAGLEARGFILGGAVAHQLSKGFVPIRKKGKLPGRTVEQDYELEYGSATVEMHDDAVEPGQKVLLVDDLLATGGTAEAGIRLIERLGGEVIGCAFVMDLPDLGGRRKLEDMGMSVHAICDLRGAVTQRARGSPRPIAPARRPARPSTTEKVAPGLTARWRAAPASSGGRGAHECPPQRPARRCGGAPSVVPLSPVVWITGPGPRAAARARQSRGKRGRSIGPQSTRAVSRAPPGPSSTVIQRRPGAKDGETSPSSSPITARTLENP
jgi:adenine phosphoribosyltransferase